MARTVQVAEGVNDPHRHAQGSDRRAGAGPAEGQTGRRDVAARGPELNAQITELQAPGLKATEAFGRAGMASSPRSTRRSAPNRPMR